MLRRLNLLFLLVGLLPMFALAQEGMSEEPEFKGTAVPDKWKNESAVILAQKIDYAYVRKSMASAMTIKEYVRKRIRLQDKNALEKFSEFYYVLYGKKTAVNFSVIKASGQTVNIDLSTAIEVNKDVPDVFRPIYLSSNTSFFKMAIPDLEIGDIIDYSYASAIDVPLEKGYGEFTPYIFTLTYNYPVVYQKFQFDLDKGTNAMFKSYNGAPKLREGDGGFDTKASDKKSLVSYFIVDKNREKVSEERWNYPYRNAPTVKLKITYTGGGLNNTLFGKKGEATAEAVDLDRLRSMYASIQYYQNPVADAMAKDVLDYLKYNGKDNLPPKELVRETYYVFRKLFLESYYTGEVKSQVPGAFGSKRKYVSKDSKKELAQKEDEVRVNRLIWAAVLIRVCSKKGLGVESIAILPRYLGKWNDLLFEEELELAIRVKGDKYYTLLPFNNFDVFGQAIETYDGSDAYAFGLIGSEGYYKANVPTTTFQDNKQQMDFTLTIADNMESVKAERISTYDGMEKDDVMTLAHLDRDYLTKDFQKYIINPKKDKADKTYSDPDREERVKIQREYLQKQIEGEGLEVEKYDSYTLLKDGRYEETPSLSFKEQYSLKKLINKAGRNYLIDIGKLIGGQIKLEDKEMQKRDNDIWLDYARTINNNITLNIPKGYTIDGWQELNMNIDNESGSFISTAKVEGDKLILTTKKIYKKNYDKKEAWPNYVAFLEAAYKFTQAKVVLKKS
ncbi:MAG TPA: DUF3857 domain-containing protein [Chitinophagaceae bacterium]|nr:DUF3857 domain-containing protein [Chitinophagaceae bacterium]